MPRQAREITIERVTPSRSGMPSANRLFAKWSRTSLFGIKSGWMDGADEYGGPAFVIEGDGR